jgi:hypothetical protein
MRWLGVRKTLMPEQKNQAAESFDAEGSFISAGKKLLDTRHPAYKAVTAVRTKIIAYWRAVTLPYPEPGIRLIKQSQTTNVYLHVAVDDDGEIGNLFELYH